MTRLSNRQLKRRAFLTKWSKLDWSKSNAELAHETGTYRQYIEWLRHKFGAPKPSYYGLPRRTIATLRWAKDNLDQLKGLSWAELAREYGLRSQKGALYKFLKPFLRHGKLLQKHRWDLMNFELPSSDLERIWRLPHNMAAGYRCRNRRPLPTWRFMRRLGAPRLIGGREYQAYRRAVKAEERNAARYFAQARVAGRACALPPAV